MDNEYYNKYMLLNQNEFCKKLESFKQKSKYSKININRHNILVPNALKLKIIGLYLNSDAKKVQLAKKFNLNYNTVNSIIENYLKNSFTLK